MLGGGLGAVSRHGVFVLMQNVSSLNFPFGTLAANLSGSFAIGLLWGLFEGTHLSQEARLFIFTGFLGGFTTFSSFTRETIQLLRVGQLKEALFYIGASNLLGITLAAVGFFLAKQLLGSPTQA